MPVLSEKRTEDIARELLEVRGWNTSRPPRGQLLWKNEYRDYDFLREAFSQRSKSGEGAGYPDFIIMDEADGRPLMVGETKSSSGAIATARDEAVFYADALIARGYPILAIGVAGNAQEEIQVRVDKHSVGGTWQSICYQEKPISWLPTPGETRVLLEDANLFDLQPRIPSEETLARRADEINRLLRECKIKDEFRPAVTGAFMLGLAQAHGNVRGEPAHVLQDINNACRNAFQNAGKYELSESILVPEANLELANRALQIIYILRLLNVTTLTAAHDYLGQLYETFFRFTGKNTIGQIFTPRHITNFMADLCQVSEADLMVDPTAGTGGFLIAALYRMMGSRRLSPTQIRDLVAKHLIGFETEPITAALCVANMILRGDGTTAVVKEDCFTSQRYPINKATLVLGNPPFPHKATDDPPEKFINRGLEALTPRGRLAMIVPASLLAKRDKSAWRKSVLRNNSLRAVITLPADLFQPYASSTTAIVLLERGIPHQSTSNTFFCHIANDGYKLKKAVRVAKPGEQLSEALDSFRKGEPIPGICRYAPLKQFADGCEWTPGAYISVEKHSFDEIADEIDSIISDHVSFHARHAKSLTEYQESLSTGAIAPKKYAELSGRKPVTNTKPNSIGGMFDIYYGQKALHSKENLLTGESLIISSKGSDNGCYGFYDFSDVIQPPFVTVPSTGSIGEASIQTWPCGVTDDCLLLIPKSATQEEDLWIAAATLRLERWRFNYGRKITPDRIKEFILSQDDELRAHVRKILNAAKQCNRAILATLSQEGMAHAAEIREQFKALSIEWKAQTKFISNIAEKSTHPAYQQIIGMGKAVIPYILEEFMQGEYSDWFWALSAITGENPISEDQAGNIEAMAEAWIEWGKARGYLNGWIHNQNPNSQTLLGLDTA